MNPPRNVRMVWHAPEMWAWCAELDDESYIDMDILEVSDRVNNAHKYATTLGVLPSDGGRDA